MYVTNCLSQITYEISVKYVEDKVKAQQHEIHNALDNLHHIRLQYVQILFLVM